MIELVGNTVLLRELRTTDATALVEAATDGELWQSPVTVIPSAATVEAYIDRALQGQRAGTVLPFVTVARASGRVIGSTRFWKIDHEHRRLEIGSTWLARSWQRTAANTEAKFLMLQHAFEAWHCVRVQFTTDVRNMASRAAILRLGAVEEGVIRNERIMPDGRKRNSVRFSIIDDEWPAVRQRLLERLEHRTQQ
ncbi:GNAT family N-acetyltransferase [Chitiniphilus eburneus]|uniref:GNAT family N-acetyltransferase n=1 Tax=Chitiniphilus eburneus TaxID=2571148 RepID=A0A4U0PZT8_9NEIS|nr:GNAT family protein [Chitiniphilus eburneus]TJZ74196.1 GNAT family N-acetyltransferase [Chitiniphilus eburneus]